MACEFPSPIFPTPYHIGIHEAYPKEDGYQLFLEWRYALPSSTSYSIGYNVYFSTDRENVFTEGAKYFTTETNTTISRFIPGDIQFFGIRATEFDSTIMNPESMPVSLQAENCYEYPETILANDINSTQLSFEVVDVSDFPASGILQLGVELLRYTNVDYPNNIIYLSSDGRGYYNSKIRIHNVDGYDGYIYQNLFLKYFAGFEDLNTYITEAEPRIDYPEYPYVESDGYKQNIKDLLTTDLSASEEYNSDYNTYDYSGYHQTNIVDYFSGHCIGSYAGGEYGCADGYKTRGFNLQDQSTQRLDMLLNVTGEPVVLLKRKWTGIRCKCFRMNNETPEGRCPSCFGVGFVSGYDQFYNPRRTDSRIMMRFEPTNDDLALRNIGMQQNFITNSWTIVYPTIKDMDVLIRFNQDGTEEFRYEIMNVNRNKLLFSLSGAQKMQLYRLDKTDIRYQFRSVRNTEAAPMTLTLSSGSLRGYGYHIHTMIVSNNVTSLSEINGTTSTVAGHNHSVIAGVVQESLKHLHTILI